MAAGECVDPDLEDVCPEVRVGNDGEAEPAPSPELLAEPIVELAEPPRLTEPALAFCDARMFPDGWTNV